MIYLELIAVQLTFISMNQKMKITLINKDNKNKETNKVKGKNKMIKAENKM